MVGVVSRGGQACWSDTARAHNGKIVILSMYGPRVAVRALWAALVRQQRNEWNGGVEVSEVGRVTIDLENRPVTTKAPLGGNAWHVVLVDPAATPRWGIDQPHFIHVGEPGSNSWVRRLSRQTNVPLRPEWAPWLWAKGVENKTVVEHAGFGTQSWHVHCDHGDWADIVTNALREGELT